MKCIQNAFKHAKHLLVIPINLINFPGKLLNSRAQEILQWRVNPVVPDPIIDIDYSEEIKIIEDEDLFGNVDMNIDEPVIEPLSSPE